MSEKKSCHSCAEPKPCALKEACKCDYLMGFPRWKPIVGRAALAAGREAGIAEAIKACENKADYWGTLNDEFANKAVMRAVDAIRALPGKEGE